jgi:hypothetical protein
LAKEKFELKAKSTFKDPVYGAIVYETKLVCKTVINGVEEHIICDYHVDDEKYAELDFAQKIVGLEGRIGKIEGAGANLGGRHTSISIDLMGRI